MSKPTRDAPPAGRSRAPVGLTYDQVLSTAMDVLDEGGIGALSLRRVAGRLGVRPNTIAWHIKDKATLLQAMSDHLMRGCADEPLPEEPYERIRLLLTRCREALLSRRDGGRLVVEGFDLTRPNHLAFAEALSGALIGAGRTPREAAWSSWTLMNLTLGLVQEQQSIPGRKPAFHAQAIDVSRHPALAQTLPFLNAEDFDARFEKSLDLILR